MKSSPGRDPEWQPLTVHQIFSAFTKFADRREVLWLLWMRESRMREIDEQSSIGKHPVWPPLAVHEIFSAFAKVPGRTEPLFE